MEFKKTVLTNGLTILHEKRDVPVTTVMLACKFGSAYETEKNKGIAHVIEHMCFKGTKKRNSQKISQEIEKVGGIINAFTHEEVTAYHTKLPSNHLGLAMDVLFDLYFDSLFDETELKKEEKVICEELKMYRDHPRSFVVEKLKGTLYEKPFGMFIAGTESNVLSFGRKEILDLHRSVYAPENTVLCVVGNNSFQEIKSFAEKFSNQIEKRKFVAPKVPAIRKINSNFEEKRKNIEQSNLAIGFHFPKVVDEDRYAAEIFNAILGDGMSSRLFSEVREKRGLVYAIKTELDLGKNYGYFVIFAGTDKEKSEEVVNLSLAEFEKMKNISDQEFLDAKEQLIGNKKVHSEDSEHTCLNLVMSEIYGNAEDYYAYEEKIRKVSKKDVAKLASVKKYSLSVLKPSE